MKKILYCTAIVCAYILQSCNAMEPSFHILKDIEEPRCGHFLTPNTVIISHKKGCTIHDLQTNTELKKISETPYAHLAVNPHKKVCALSKDKLQIYNIETSILQWENESPGLIASIFDPLDEGAILLLHEDNYIISRFNYKKGSGLQQDHSYRGEFAPTIAFHPTEKIMCRAANRGIISIHNSNSLQKFEYHSSIKIRQRDTPAWHTFCQFNPDGSLLIEGNQQKFRMHDNKNGTLRPGTMKNTHDIIFHPNGQFIITLSQPNNLISYWDLINRPATPTISMSCSPTEDNPPTKHNHMHTYLSCDPLGENLLVILSRQCFIIPMPFEVIYQPQTKEKCISACFALQNHLLKDLQRVLIRRLLTLCKR